MAPLEGQRVSKLFSTVIEVAERTRSASAYYEGTVVPGESREGYVRIAYDDDTEEELPVRLDEALEGRFFRSCLLLISEILLNRLERRSAAGPSGFTRNVASAPKPPPDGALRSSSLSRA